VARRLRLTVEYDGTDFAGWQRQANGATIQQELERAIARMTGVVTAVRGAGRTDAGVHALGQVAHFDTDSTIPLIGFRRGLNALLPRAIAVVALDEAAADFDARFSARGKLYRYEIWNADSRSPLRDRFVWHLRQPLDRARMRQAAASLVGRHDFLAFRAADCERATTVRTVTRLDVLDEGARIAIEIEANAFLKNMVRIVTGTLVAVGRGRISPERVAEILAARDRQHAGPTAPPQGLVLVHVDY
jgi:tRNA pseudouridine38-40 synthase